MPIADLLSGSSSWIFSYPVAALLFLSFLLIKYHDRAILSTNSPPVPADKGLPILGQSLIVVRQLYRRYDFYVDQQLRHGPAFCFTIPFVGRVLFVNRLDWADYMFKTNSENFVKGPYFRRMVNEVLGGGLIGADGHDWKWQRRLAMRLFSPKEFRTHTQNVVQKYTLALRKLFDQAADTNRVVDLCELFHRFTMGTFIEQSCGVDWHLLDSLDQEPHPFGLAFERAQEIFADRFLNPIFELTEKFTQSGRDMRHAHKVMDDTVLAIIKERRQQHASERMSTRTAYGQIDEISGKRANFMDVLLTMTDEQGRPFEDMMVRDFIVNFLVAARDTTAQTLSWMTWHLAKNPSASAYLDRIREEELLNVTDDHNGLLAYDEMKNAPLTQALFYETARLYPGAPRISRQVVKYDVFPNGGPVVRPGDLVLYCDYAVARDPSQWGPLANKFIPERFLQSQTPPSSLQSTPQLGSSPLIASSPSFESGTSITSAQLMPSFSQLRESSDAQISKLASASNIVKNIDQSTFPTPPLSRAASQEMEKEKRTGYSTGVQSKFTEEKLAARIATIGPAFEYVKPSLSKESLAAFRAFSTGPRSCPGRELAMFEAMSVVLGCLTHYDLILEPGQEELPKYKTAVTLALKEPLLARIRRREVY